MYSETTWETTEKKFFKEERVINKQGRWNRIIKHSQLTQEKAGKEKSTEGTSEFTLNLKTDWLK